MKVTKASLLKLCLWTRSVSILPGTVVEKGLSQSGHFPSPGTQPRQIGCPHGTKTTGSVNSSMHLKHCRLPSVELYIQRQKHLIKIKQFSMKRLTIQVSSLLQNWPTDYSLSLAILIYSITELIPPYWSLIKRTCSR